MSDYPNIEAIANGTIAGNFRDWPRVRPEAKALLAELDRLRLAQRVQSDYETETPFGQALMDGSEE